MKYHEFFSDLALQYGSTTISDNDATVIADVLDTNSGLTPLACPKIFVDFWIMIIHGRTNYKFVQNGKLLSNFTDIDVANDFWGIEYTRYAIKIYPVNSEDPKAYKKTPEESYFI